ncbi:conjugative transfer signal peptidase TraF [Nitratidesulfovibrio liaohensis]|jgi:conjugative transfer signal peptidase TraF|uniref:signal peptidase I n=1 Tax=Nitratidesulfovibrio liaohensis TaxID=2604158 RepID=A0ABY9R3L4_9BACT|nr:conjugative transfer signal peptidase TraF [Nitratidesulfovibrio liaohensis]WMW66350.1 conjugative transfer signal peptidase TraF [Nitratidesulfovibrio liaohensis]
MIRAAMAILLACLLVAGARVLRVNNTASMPRGIYILDPLHEPARGDLVSLCAPGAWAALARERGYLGEGLCPEGTKPLLKRLVGIPGDVVAMRPEGVLVNAMARPRSAPHGHDRNGRPIPAHFPNGTIPFGFGLALSEHPDGFDARYFGWVPLDAMTRVVPLLTFNSME